MQYASRESQRNNWGIFVRHKDGEWRQYFRWTQRPNIDVQDLQSNLHITKIT